MNRTHRRLAILVAATSLVAVACGSDDDSSSDTTAAATEITLTPATISADEQSSDGSTVVATVDLPSAGFIVIHGNADGAPGPVIGHSELLQAGESTDVVISLDTALTESGMVFPMAHVDVNGNGEYEFAPPDVTTDAPATTESGDVAVIGVVVNVD